MSEGPAERLVRRVWAELARDPAELESLDRLPAAPLPARLDVSGLAVGSVAVASLAAGSMTTVGGRAPRGSRVRLDGTRIATAFTSERWFLHDGVRPEVWAPLSGFWRAADGWVRTHGNYPHHAAALWRTLGLSAGADGDVVRDAILAWRAEELATAVTAAGGLCVAVRSEDPVIDAALTERPLIDVARLGEAPARTPSTDAAAQAPLAGVRVLDLTRVIAGPVATRTLALLGADVLRIDPPEPAELGSQHLDTGAGKRSAILDVRRMEDAAQFNMLLGRADVVVLGYRPASLARHALDPQSLVAWHPGLVIAQLSAWGFDADQSGRAGFDSLVQAASGIALVEGSLDRPGVLPAQALDHSTGYLLAGAVMSLLDRQRRDGGSWLARMSLRRTAAELLSMPRTTEPTPEVGLDGETASEHLETLEGAVDVRVPRPAIALDTPLDHWPAAPNPWGSDAPRWAG